VVYSFSEIFILIRNWNRSKGNCGAKKNSAEKCADNYSGALNTEIKRLCKDLVSGDGTKT
jgi:hypothetical protein